MHSTGNFQVLRVFHPVARSLTVYSAASFSCKNATHTIVRNLLEAIVCTVVLLSLPGVGVLSIWTYSTLDQAWNQRAYYLVVLLCVIQQMVNFTSMSIQSHRFLDALKQLQNIIDNRKDLTFFSQKIFFGSAKRSFFI